MSPTGSNADPREAKKPQIGWLFSVVLVRVSAGHQPTCSSVRLSRSYSRGQVSHLPAPSSRALVADEQESETNGRIGDRGRYWRLSCHPALPLAAINYAPQGKASTRDDWAAPSATPKKQKRRDWEAAADVWKAFCWIIGLVQAEEMRMLWILRTPAGKKVQLSLPFCLFCPIGLVRKPWSLWRPTQPMQMMRYDRRKLHALEMVPT
jgi:hypothetical protein